MIAFKKGENKEKIARPYFEAAAQEGKEKVVLIATRESGRADVRIKSAI